MIGLLITLLVLLLIGIAKVGVRVIFDEDLKLFVLAGPVRICLLGKDKSDKGTKKEKEAQKEKTPKKAKKETKDPKEANSDKKKAKNPWVGALLAYWMELLELVGRVFAMPVVDELDLRITFGGADPADSALNYGRACAAAGSLLPILENSIRISSPNVELVYDTDAKDLKYYVRAALTVRIYQIIAWVFAAIGLLWKIYQEKKRNEKAVQE